MTWVRLDEAMPEHPKVAALGDSAFALWITSIAYANRNLTDGFVPSAVGIGQLRYCDGNPIPAIRELEDAGIWHKVDGGWEIHDFLDYQPSKANVLAEREAARERMARRRSSDVRSKDAADVPPNTSRGSPTAVPVSEPVTPEVQTPSATASRRRSYPTAFDTFWQAYPSEGRRDKPKAFAEWERAVKRLAAELIGTEGEDLDEEAAGRIVVGAERYAADPNRDPAKTKYAQGWLSGDRWNDPPLPAETPNGRVVPGARSNALARELGS